MKMIENLKIFFLDFLRNIDINLYKTSTSRVLAFPEHGIFFPGARLRSGTMGINGTVHQMVSVRYELGENSSRTFSVQVNIQNLICKIKRIKKGKSITNLQQQNLPAIASQPELQLPTSFVEKFGAALELYRNKIIILCWACAFLEFLYKDTKKAGYYCNVKIPAGQSNNELFEFRKEFLLPTKFINSDNFCEKLSETSSLNLEPIDVFYNFYKFQSFCINIISPVGKIAMRIIFVIPLANLVHEAVFVGYLQIRTKNSFGVIITGILSFIFTYAIIDNIFNISIFCMSAAFNFFNFTTRSIVRIIKSDKV